jgi:hypothetical protein
MHTHTHNTLEGCNSMEVYIVLMLLARNYIFYTNLAAVWLQLNIQVIKIHTLVDHEQTTYWYDVQQCTR